MKNQGFTLIEILIVIAIVGIFIAIVVPLTSLGYSNGANSYSIGVNGMVEERCIGGYKFVIGNKGQPTQVLDQYGKGSPC